jgi:hypothetical protein
MEELLRNYLLNEVLSCNYACFEGKWVFGTGHNQCTVAIFWKRSLITEKEVSENKQASQCWSSKLQPSKAQHDHQERVEHKNSLQLII